MFVETLPPPLPTVIPLIVASVSLDIEPVTPSEPVIWAEPVNGKAVPGRFVSFEPSPINSEALTYPEADIGRFDVIRF